jgi:hypothetical protein
VKENAQLSWSRLGLCGALFERSGVEELDADAREFGQRRVRHRETASRTGAMRKSRSDAWMILARWQLGRLHPVNTGVSTPSSRSGPSGQVS